LKGSEVQGSEVQKQGIERFENFDVLVTLMVDLAPVVASTPNQEHITFEPRTQNLQK
jgi:hypothetical protein